MKIVDGSIHQKVHLVVGVQIPNTYVTAKFEAVLRSEQLVGNGYLV